MGEKDAEGRTLAAADRTGEKDREGVSWYGSDVVGAVLESFLLPNPGFSLCRSGSFGSRCTLTFFCGELDNDRRDDDLVNRLIRDAILKSSSIWDVLMLLSLFLLLLLLEPLPLLRTCPNQFSIDVSRGSSL